MSLTRKIRVFGIWISLSWLTQTMSLYSLAWAQLTRLNVSYSSISTEQLPAWIAKETGIYAQNGLDVQLIYTAPNMGVVALLSGDTPIAQASGPGIVSSRLGGSDAVMVAAGFIALDHWLLARKEIKTAQQLKGGVVAVGRIGSSNDHIARFALRSIGLTPLKDVSMMATGSPLDRLAALESGRAQATALTFPSSFVLWKKGFNILADLSTLEFPFQTTGIATTRRFIQKNSEVIKKYVKAQIEAVHRLKKDRGTTLKILAKYFVGVKDTEAFEKAYDRVVTNDKIVPPKQYPTVEGIKSVLDMMAENEPRAKKANPEDFVEMRFVKELDDSGFIDRLYQR
jgi:NitT/TauT family transport system substrate-binding protein